MARAPELLSLQYCNSPETGLRNLFVENGNLFFVTYYYKGYSIKGSTKIIYRYLPRKVGELLIYYLWLVYPFISRISGSIFKKNLSTYLFEIPPLSTKKTQSQAKKITSERLRTIFRRETLAGLGTPINPSQYRHLAIGISRRFLSKNLYFQPEEDPNLDGEDSLDYEDDIVDLQAGHGTRTAGLVYGRGLLEPGGEIQSIKKRFEATSLVSIFFLYIFFYFWP